MDDRCSETRIINIQAATTSLQCSSQTGIRGLEGSVSRESVGRGMEIWPRFDFFFSVAAGQNYDPAPRYESVGGRAVPWVCVGPCWPGWLLPTVAGSRRKCRPAGILREMSTNAEHPLA